MKKAFLGSLVVGMVAMMRASLGQSVQQITGLPSGPDISSIAQAVGWNGTLYFNGWQDTTTELWKSNGTPETTQRVRSVAPGNPQGLRISGNLLFFRAGDAEHGDELWKTDGTEAGTQLVKDIRAGTSGSNLFNLTDAGGTLFFLADDGLNGRQVWKSDGTEAGTVMLKPATTPPMVPFSTPNQAAAAGTTFFFGANNMSPLPPLAGNGRELWKSTGSAETTSLVKDTNPGFADALSATNVLRLTAMGQHVYFQASSPSAAKALWKSDGTEIGTVQVKAFSGSNIRSITSAGKRVYFATDEAVWGSDGTEAGTQLLADPFPGTTSAMPHQLSAVGDRLFFFAHDSPGNEGADLWVINGDAANTATKIAGALPQEIDDIVSCAATDELLFFVTRDFIENPSPRKVPALDERRHTRGNKVDSRSARF